MRQSPPALLFPFFAKEPPSMRKNQSCFFVAMTVALAMVPRLSEAGPCSSDIADLETTIHQPGVEALGEPEQQSASVPPNLPAPEMARRADEHLQSQFSATVARAKRLDMYGDRVGCSGALNAAKAMYLLVDKG
jgi:hypothetical protein